MDMLEEKNRLLKLQKTGMFVEKSTGKYWRVKDVSHNIYKDVVLKIYDGSQVKELIEGSEEYCKNFKRVDDVCNY